MDFNHLLKRAVAEPEDYRDEKGFLYCGKCRTRREMTVNICGEPYIVRIACKCREEAQNREDKHAEDLERAQRIERRRQWALGDSRLFESTFDRDDGKTKIAGAMQKYAQNFDQMRDSNTGLLLFGPVGTGKTFLAACIVNEVCKNWTARMTSFARISEEISANMNFRKSIIRDLSRADLLVLDDLGAERQSSYMSEIVFEVVDTRYSAKRPLIVTTNMTLDEIRRPKDSQYARIYDRITEMCEPVLIDGPSRRIEKAKNRGTREFLGI